MLQNRENDPAVFIKSSFHYDKSKWMTGEMMSSQLRGPGLAGFPPTASSDA